MSYHRCPIEPGDWSDGDDPPEAMECEDCHGTGWEDEDAGVPCTTCNGEGFASLDDDDYYDPDEWY